MKRKELEEKIIAELRALAKKSGITLKATKKAEIISEILKSKIKPVKKPVKKPAEKKVTKPTKVPRPAKKPSKVLKPIAAKKPAKPKAPEVKEARKAKPPAPKITLPKIKLSKKKLPEPMRGHVEVRTEFTIFPGLPIRELPIEYGENTITAITLSPDKIFSYWEITEKTITRLKGEPTLRVYEGPSNLSNAESAETFFDIRVPYRTGSIYIDVKPDRGFCIDLGVISPRGFVRTARSSIISTSSALPSEKGKAGAVLPEAYYEPATYGWYEG